MTRLTTWTHDGLTFAVRDEGPEDGPPVLLLHGFPQRATSWDAVTPLLHQQGFRTLAPDQRGYSPGARPRRRRDYAAEHLVADAAALAEVVGTPVHLVGHDWGSLVAWLLAGHRPDLVRSLVAVSVPHPGAFVESFRRSDQLRRSWYMAFFQLPWVPEKVLASPRGEGAFRAGGMTREMVARYRAEVVQDGALRGGLLWYRGMPFTRRRTLRRPVRVPTTMVWSDHDVALARTGAELTERWVDAPYRLEVLPGVSHWIPEEAPETLAALIAERARSASEG
ncbi:alpha/beta fold hydrolase [Nocardioides coralli]|uniref:alpha/beta fold hydrolase n=1 Tax=Nocardioides coralli TaxID=2872154 RepID=UPI001CA3AFD0|nr:alpha/beta fold hydrolase [Nocardioides coralli]QZY30171.1 alpha/beta fold hydrolase [Nocardioides coralli]